MYTVYFSHILFKHHPKLLLLCQTPYHPTYVKACKHVIHITANCTMQEAPNCCIPKSFGCVVETKEGGNMAPTHCHSNEVCIHLSCMHSSEFKWSTPSLPTFITCGFFSSSSSVLADASTEVMLYIVSDLSSES